MSASEPPGDPDAWDPDDTGGVPVGPEPEPTSAGGAGGAGGWGAAPRVEPFAIAALVWAIVSIVVPVIGTIVAFVLAAKAADVIRRSRGERAGTQYVTAARIIAGAVLALWVIGGVAFLALRDDGSSNDNVAVPTQPPPTTVALTTTSSTPLTTTTTHPPATTTTAPPPTISVVPPPPTQAPTTTPPTAPPTTVTPTTTPPTSTSTTPTTTTKPPPSTTTPDEAAAKVQTKLIETVKPSNRGVPDDERFAVSYTPGQDLLVTWAINNGQVGEHPTGTPTCGTPGGSTTTTASTTTSSTPTTVPQPTSPTQPSQHTTPEQARFEAKQILQSIKPQLKTLKLDVPGVQLVGTYPIEGAGDDAVVQVLYSKATVQGNLPAFKKMFDVPPAEALQCLNPAFELH